MQELAVKSENTAVLMDPEELPILEYQRDLVQISLKETLTEHHDRFPVLLNSGNVTENSISKAEKEEPIKIDVGSQTMSEEEREKMDDSSRISSDSSSEDGELEFRGDDTEWDYSPEFLEMLSRSHHHQRSPSPPPPPNRFRYSSWF
uniref:Uncharacterized protein n=1 Tax=Caenorhabditis tropicalis TaxID=1561998 RepID=A0A1I7UPK9_9PELO